ncbi:uncharacterized protein B0H64DRAFT_335875 [Chaetomium fimeti]|uniref:Uncharacterized protein n=1 Tax=Chaetomium fimeti TaxID=1854472 RepID=A0AAE0LUY6_9PEZI|nr:hypothetical protein B0H64DRAFT_335875 [Chaetomium fimeti]
MVCDVISGWERASNASVRSLFFSQGRCLDRAGGARGSADRAEQGWLRACGVGFFSFIIYPTTTCVNILLSLVLWPFNPDTLSNQTCVGCLP